MKIGAFIAVSCVLGAASLAGAPPERGATFQDNAATQPSSLASPTTLPAASQLELGVLTSQPSSDVTPLPKAEAGSKAVVIELQGEINDFNRDKLFRRFDAARKLGAKTVILDLDSYGGLVTSGLEISRFLKRQDDLYTIAYVEDKAISAGAMIAMACNEIVMSPSASLGDCAPIIFNTEHLLEPLPAAERAKQESPIVMDFEESARHNHRDLLLARAMVSVQISVYWVQAPTGERRFVDKDEYAALKAAGWKDAPGAPAPIDSDTTLLTVDSAHAVMYGLASGESASAEALANQRGYPVLTTFRTGAGEKLVELLSSWPARMILIIIFISCVKIVINMPGHGVGEVVGLGALGLMLGVPLLTGYAQWWEILIIFVGLSLVAFEILLPGHIIPGVVGGCLVVFGLVMTFVPMNPAGMPGFMPHLQGTGAAFQRGLAVVAGGLGCSLFVWFWLNRLMPRAPYFNRLIIKSVSGGGGPAPSPAQPPAGSWPVVGNVGRALSELKPGGSAEFYDEATADRRVTSVVCDSGFVSPGTKIVVREVAGNRVVVRAVSGDLTHVE